MVTATTQARRNELSKSLGLLEEIGQYDPLVAQKQAFLGMNRWIARQPDTDDWTLDPLSEELPAYLFKILRKTGPGALRFQAEDIDYLQAHIFLREIANFVAETDSVDPLVTHWIAADSTLSDEQRAHLSLAARMFDWTVRSIQLSHSRPEVRRPKPSVGPLPQLPGQNKKETSEPPPSRIGPGQMFHVSETLLKGHGDMLDKARVFIQLARQRGIPVVILAREEPQFIESTPWLCGAMIGTQLYLFDMQLGLPVPTPNRTGIATLAAVQEQPEILSQLGTSGAPYPVQTADVQRVTIQLDASPQALSRRMRRIEQQLAGDRKMVLTSRPSELARRLKRLRGVEKIEILQAPYAALRYRKYLQAKIKKDKNTANPIVRELLVIKTLLPLFQARILHFQGHFDSEDNQRGAKSLYLDCRPPNAYLQQLKTDQYSRQIQLIIQAKQSASYWMGLITFATNEYEAARDWFAKRTLQATPEGLWTHGARYNLARTWEMLNEPQRAREIYRSDDSPQQAGNALRAELLDDRAVDAS